MSRSEIVSARKRDKFRTSEFRRWGWGRSRGKRLRKSQRRSRKNVEVIALAIGPLPCLGRGETSWKLIREHRWSAGVSVNRSGIQQSTDDLIFVCRKKFFENIIDTREIGNAQIFCAYKRKCFFFLFFYTNSFRHTNKLVSRKIRWLESSLEVSVHPPSVALMKIISERDVDCDFDSMRFYTLSLSLSRETKGLLEKEFFACLRCHRKYLRDGILPSSAFPALRSTYEGTGSITA